MSGFNGYPWNYGVNMQTSRINNGYGDYATQTFQHTNPMARGTLQINSFLPGSGRFTIDNRSNQFPFNGFPLMLGALDNAGLFPLPYEGTGRWLLDPNFNPIEQSWANKITNLYTTNLDRSGYRFPQPFGRS